MPSQRTIEKAREYELKVLGLLEQAGSWEVPADALSAMARAIGWRLEFPILPSDRWAECDRGNQVIRVTADLADRLECPEQVRQVAHSCLAHELAHAVLHSAPRRSRWVPKSWEWEARIFAAVCLCPWWLLSVQPEVRALRGNCLTQRERWGRVRDLADRFRVTTSFMVSALVLHGVLERTEGGGIQAPATLATPARAWKAA